MTQAQIERKLRKLSKELCCFPPRITTAQRDALTDPAEGTVIYNTSTKKLNFWNGTSWAVVTSV